MAKYLLFFDYEVGYWLARTGASYVNFYKNKEVELPEAVGEKILEVQEQHEIVEGNLHCLWNKKETNWEKLT